MYKCTHFSLPLFWRNNCSCCCPGGKHSAPSSLAITAFFFPLKILRAVDICWYGRPVQVLDWQTGNHTSGDPDVPSESTDCSPASPSTLVPPVQKLSSLLFFSFYHNNCRFLSLPVTGYIVLVPRPSCHGSMAAIIHSDICPSAANYKRVKSRILFLSPSNQCSLPFSSLFNQHQSPLIFSYCSLMVW